MPTKYQGRISNVRVSTKSGSATLIIDVAGKQKQLIVSGKQLESATGVVRPHSLVGAGISWELWNPGEKYGPNNGLEQTQERFDAGLGSKDFSITLSQGQDLTNGMLLEFRKGVKEMFSGFGASMAPAAAPAAEETAAPAPPAPAVNPEELLGDTAAPATTTAQEPALQIDETI
jgi:hypothetical protein